MSDTSETAMVQVELHNTAPECVEATRATVRMLRPGADLVEREGRYYVQDGYVAWACVRQGYVRAVIRQR